MCSEYTIAQTNDWSKNVTLVKNSFYFTDMARSKRPVSADISAMKTFNSPGKVTIYHLGRQIFICKYWKLSYIEICFLHIVPLTTSNNVFFQIFKRVVSVLYLDIAVLHHRCTWECWTERGLPENPRRGSSRPDKGQWRMTCAY